MIGVLLFFTTRHLVRGLGRLQGQLALHLLVASAAGIEALNRAGNRSRRG